MKRLLLTFVPMGLRVYVKAMFSRLKFIMKFGTDYYRLSNFKRVRGYLNDDEAVELFDIARRIGSQTPQIVELGSWMGKSAVVFCAALNNRTHSNIHCVDAFEVEADRDPKVQSRYQLDVEAEAKTQIEAFHENIRAFGNPEMVKIHKGLTSQIVKKWDAPIDLLFIDADHEYQSVKEDFENWSRYVSKGGFVCLDDTWLQAPEGAKKWHKGPGKFVKEDLQKLPEWRFISHTNSLYCVQRVVP